MKYLLLFIFITTTCIVKAQDFAALKAGQSKAERIILNDEDLKTMMAFYDPSANKTQNKLITSVQANAIVNISHRYCLLWRWFYSDRKNIAMPVSGFM
jgi:hypothetical protein